MNQQPPVQKLKRKLSKGFIITILVIIVAILGWAGLTKADFIPNYFGFEFLYHGGNLVDFNNRLDFIEDMSNIYYGKEANSYTPACPCCCFMAPKQICLYHAKGDDLKKIIKEDKKSNKSSDCGDFGCRMPIKYEYCD